MSYEIKVMKSIARKFQYFWGFENYLFFCHLELIHRFLNGYVRIIGNLLSQNLFWVSLQTKAYCSVNGSWIIALLALICHTEGNQFWKWIWNVHGTTVYHSVPYGNSTTVYHNVPQCTMGYHSVPQGTRVYHRLPWGTTISPWLTMGY